MENRAQYNSSSKGVNYSNGGNTKYNEQGFTPNIGTPAKGDASSTTKSAIADGTIEVRSNPNQDLSQLSRDTDKALNELGKIFDKKKIEEQQELANLFGKLAFEEVHKVSAKAKENAQTELDNAKANKNSTPEQLAALQAKVDAWSEGGTNKIALHALVGGIMSDITGNGFTSGAVGAGVNEAVQKELEKRFKDQPDMWQWASTLIGAAAAQAVGGDAQAGASTAASGTKNNDQLLSKINLGQLVQTIVVAGIAYEAKKTSDGVICLVSKAGEAIATWDQETRQWIANVDLAVGSQQTIDSLNNTLSIANQQIASSEKTIQSANDTIQESQQIIAETRNQIAVIKSQIIEYNEDISQLETHIAQLEADINEREEKISNLEKNIAILKARKADILSKYYPLGTDISAGEEHSKPKVTVFPGESQTTVTTTPPLEPNAPDMSNPPMVPTEEKNKPTITDMPMGTVETPTRLDISEGVNKDVYKAGDQTPGGRTFTNHGAERANERGFDSQIIDSIINNNKNTRVKEIDSASGEVTWRYQDRRGNTVVTNEWGNKIVTVYSYPESENNGNYVSKK